MTAVQTQTPPQAAQAGAVMPAEQAPLTAAAPPVAGTPTPTLNTPGANPTEMPAGAGGGVDLSSMDDVTKLERFIAAMPGDEELEAVPNPAPAAAPAAAPAPEAQAPAVQEPAAAAPEDDDRMLPPGQLPNGIKLPVKDDPLAFQTAKLFKDSRLSGGRLTLGQAEKMAREMLGLPAEDSNGAPAVETASSEAAGAAPTPANPGQRRSEVLQAELTQMEQEFEAAAQAFDPVGQSNALRRINEINREMTRAVMQEAQQEAAAEVQQAEAQQTFLQQWEANRDQAYAQFAHADAANPASAVHRRAVELQNSYLSSEDPGKQAIANSPESALWFFTQAALGLGIAPQAGQAAPAAAPAPTAIQPNTHKSTPPPVPPQTPVGAHLLSGSPPGSTRPAATAGLELVNRINSAHDLEALIAVLPGA